MRAQDEKTDLSKGHRHVSEIFSCACLSLSCGLQEFGMGELSSRFICLAAMPLFPQVGSCSFCTSRYSVGSILLNSIHLR